MAALSITAASVAYVSGPVQQDAVAGEAFVAGAMLYFNTSDQRWYKAKCASATVAQAGQDGIGMALFTADAAGARGSVARPGAVVTIGAGTAGSPYFIGPTAGNLNPLADVVTSTYKVTFAAMGRGSSQVQLGYLYDAGSVAP